MHENCFTRAADDYVSYISITYKICIYFKIFLTFYAHLFIQ